MKLKSDNVEVDLSMVYEIAGKDESYVKLMVATFISTMPSTIERIENAFEAKDWGTLYSAAHFAKSSLSVIGVGNMLSVVKEIEVNAKNQVNLDSLESLVSSVSSQYKKAEQLLAVHFPG